jgi:hypothetical protein
MLEAVMSCVTDNEPVTMAFPFISNVEFAYDLLTATPVPASYIELVVSVVALLNFVI